MFLQVRVEEGSESEDELEKKTKVRSEGMIGDDEASEMLGSNIFERSSLGGGRKKKQAKKKAKAKPAAPKNESLLSAKKKVSHLSRKMLEAKAWGAKLKDAKVPPGTYIGRHLDP